MTAKTKTKTDRFLALLRTARGVTPAAAAKKLETTENAIHCMLYRIRREIGLDVTRTPGGAYRL